MNDRPEGERSDRLGGKNQGADLRLRHRSRGLVWGPWSFAEGGALKNGSAYALEMTISSSVDPEYPRGQAFLHSIGG